MNETGNAAMNPFSAPPPGGSHDRLRLTVRSLLDDTFPIHPNPMKTPLNVLLLLFSAFLLSITVHADTWGDPTGFFEDADIDREELHPGVVWWSIEGELNERPVRASLVTVDLTRPGLSLKAVAGERFVNMENEQYFRRSTVSQLQQDNDALAAINVAFFDIGTTQAPLGLAIHDGLILREPSGRSNFLYLPDGRVTLADLGWEAQIRAGAQRRPLKGINRPGIGGDEVVLFLPPWALSPGTTGSFTKGQQVREIVLEKLAFQPAADSSDHARLTGRVLEIRDNKPGVEIGEDQFVLTASASAAPFFRHVNPGMEIEINWRLTGAPEGVEWHMVRELVSSSPVLVRNGVAEKGSNAFWKDRHPRSAGGISADGRHLLLVVVDGRSEESVGINLDDLARFMIHLGAHDALNFDGGGSSAMVAQVDGQSQLLNHPSGSIERYVATGLGVIASGDGLTGTRTWTGANGRTMSGIFQDYNPATEHVTLILDGRRFTFPLSSLSAADQALILRASPAGN